MSVDVAALQQELDRLRGENAQLTALLDAVADRLLLSTTDGRLLYMNAAAHRTFQTVAGVAAGNPIGKSIREVGAPEVLLRHHDQLVAELLEAGGAITRTLLLPTTLGERWQEDHVSPVRGEDGTLHAIAIVGHDIHERKLAEEFREQMIGVLGHDLRNPLTAISALASLSLRGTPLPDRLGPRMEQIEKAAARALEMIKSLLQFSEGRFRGFPIVARRTDLREICRAVIDEVAAAHVGRAIELGTEGDCTCECDPARLGQVIANLTSNALAYGTRDRPVRLEVAGAPATLDVRVSNHGPAIPPELRARLFEPFQRGPGAAGQARGLGLGLYIVREIVNAHRGTVTVTSTEPEGTCFTVSLPRAKA